MGIKSYEQVERQIEDPKVSEAKVMLTVTKGLERHAEEGRYSEQLKYYLVKNQQMWVRMRNDVASEDNKLPTRVKAQLLSLALWVERHTAVVLTGQGEVSDLIDVNRSISDGLMGKKVVTTNEDQHLQAVGA